MNPLKQAVDSGIKANDMIGRMISKVGTEAHPRGYVHTAYRNAGLAIESALKAERKTQAINDVLAGLRKTIESDSTAILYDAQQAGAEESAKQMRFYGISSTVNGVEIALSNKRQVAMDAIMARVDSQIATINAMLMTEHDDGQIFGDEHHDGLLRASDISIAAAYWLTALLWGAFDYWTGKYSGEIKFQKQAIAALDARTTDCCLRVHGQIRSLNGLFTLTGTPRFADAMDWAPFHWYCRTSVALYLPGFDGGITESMLEAAAWFLAQRAQGKNPDNDPANAF